MATSTNSGVNWKALAIGTGGVLATAGLIWVVVSGVETGRGERPDAPAGVETFTAINAQHIDGAIDYGTTDPPPGGNHNTQWHACGFYGNEIRTENAVHSMEHGVVWITYRAGLSDDETSILESLGRRSETIVSLFPGQSAPVIATAWGNQLKLQSATDDRLDQFHGAFRDAPSAPEPLASCANGIVT